MRTLAEPILDNLGPVPYAAMQQALDPLWGRGAHNYFTSAMLDGLPDEAIGELLDQWSAKPTPQCELHVWHAGGGYGSGGPVGDGIRAAPVALHSRDHRPLAGRRGIRRSRAWARDTRAGLARYGPGAMYVNFTGEAGEDKVRASYPAETYAKLVAVKDRYDPTNVFRLNQNIPPSDSSAAAR